MKSIWSLCVLGKNRLQVFVPYSCKMDLATLESNKETLLLNTRNFTFLNSIQRNQFHPWTLITGNRKAGWSYSILLWWWLKTFQIALIRLSLLKPRLVQLYVLQHCALQKSALVEERYRSLLLSERCCWRELWRQIFAFKLITWICFEPRMAWIMSKGAELLKAKVKVCIYTQYCEDSSRFYKM